MVIVLFEFQKLTIILTEVEKQKHGNRKITFRLNNTNFVPSKIIFHDKFI